MRTHVHVGVGVRACVAGPFDPSPHHLTNVESEDSHVFIDPRGNFHMLTNVNTGHRRCPQGVECGGHAWSTDGKNFSDIYIGAFGPYLTFANGLCPKGPLLLCLVTTPPVPADLVQPHRTLLFAECQTWEFWAVCDGGVLFSACYARNWLEQLVC
jgi:hypothetical protein